MAPAVASLTEVLGHSPDFGGRRPLRLSPPGPRSHTAGSRTSSATPAPALAAVGLTAARPAAPNPR